MLFKTGLTRSIGCVAFVMLFAYALQAQVSYSLVAGLSTGLIKPKGDNLQTAGIRGVNFGFLSEKNFGSNKSLCFGLTYHLININKYKNEITYASFWVNGPEEDEITLETSIRQQYLEIPVILKFNRSRFSYGAGMILGYLVASELSQHVSGYYNAPPQYPDASPEYNASLKYVLTIDSDKKTAPFHKVNIAPLLNAGYKITDKLRIDLLLSYDLLQNPAYVNVQFNKYALLKSNLLLTFKIK